MKAIVEFRIRETLCAVVPEEEVSGNESSGPTGSRPIAGQVIGNCSLFGHRYLILRAAPSKDPNPLPAPVDLLTPRELQVAALVAEGHGNKQIAHRLRLSEWTVSSYLRRIFVKLGVRTRAAMVARVLAARDH
ncbi:helix-turn-helix transcriptional regulator [Thioalkalicoccus limnaeus]|uniref:Helix-turn-helix transcriptional regulator n=1 Tax=Thioalkalicoccus limnaeus TaxID=120681 RepID=A0ABV4BBH1_9GAMM